MNLVIATRLLTLQLKLRATATELASIPSLHVKKCCEDIMEVANEMRTLAKTPPAMIPAGQPRLRKN